MKDAARAHARCLPPPHCGTRVSAERGLRGKSSQIFRERRVTGARKYGGLFHYRQRADFQNQTGVEPDPESTSDGPSTTDLDGDNLFRINSCL